MTAKITENQSKKRGAKPTKTPTQLIRVPQSARVSASYLTLVATYPIHPIRSDEDLDEAIAMVDKLLCRREPLDAQEQDYQESLAHEIERYENEAYPLPEVSEDGMLRHLLDARGATLTEASKSTGIAISTLSAILKGKRRLNRQHIETLANYFGVEPGVFLAW